MGFKDNDDVDLYLEEKNAFEENDEVNECSLQAKRKKGKKDATNKR